MIEVLKQALKAFEVATTPLAKDRQEVLEAVAAIKQAIAELESQEPFGYWNATDGWVTVSQEEGFDQVKTAPKWLLKYKWVTGRGYVVWRDVFEGKMKCSLDEAVTSHTQAVFVDEADAKDYCNFKNTTPSQRTEQNFCSRCGKRTADLTTIHTCTPPQD
jgi:hypothetical protein